MTPRCPSVGPEGYRCRKRLHPPVTPEAAEDLLKCHVAYGWQGQMFWDDESEMERPEQLVSMGDDHEIVWNVSRLEDETLSPEATRTMIRPLLYVDPALVNRRNSYWKTVDTHTPVIMIPHPETGRGVVVDGRHRLYKAWRLDIDMIPCYVLTHEQEMRCRASDDEASWYERQPQRAR